VAYLRPADLEIIISGRQSKLPEHFETEEQL
jgi:hypothetical protein